MVKNYASIILLGCFLIGGKFAKAQEITIFSSKDFDLQGKVKTCIVVTKYGKEEYDFNERGLLTKSVTRYNDDDYSVTYYKYDANYLIEKRVENYHDNQFNTITSLAHFYTIDSTSTKKITEKIFSYDKEILDQYEYWYNSDDAIKKIVRTNNNGVDETLVEYKNLKGEATTSYLLNGIILKSVRTSKRKNKNKKLERVVLTKNYITGKPNTAEEAIYSAESDKLISKTTYRFNEKENQFAIENVTTYGYDTKGFLTKSKLTSGENLENKEYIHQFDDEEKGNWVKQIVTPDNTYTTRKISYYPEETLVED